MLGSIWSGIAAAKSAIATGAICIALCLPLGYCKGYEAATSKATAERALANVDAQKRAVSVADIAATERVVDALAAAKEEGSLTDAIADTPDGAPDSVRVALGCQRLRQAGTADADLPAVCRSPGGE